MYGDLQGIAGRSLQEIDILEGPMLLVVSRFGNNKAPYSFGDALDSCYGVFRIGQRVNRPKN
jgi:hypothetical protein